MELDFLEKNLIKINKMKLDFLEKNLVKTLTMCSVYTALEVEYVYENTKSWDKTIRVLKTADGNAMGIRKALEMVG